LEGEKVGFVLEEEGGGEEEADETITTQKAAVEEGEEVMGFLVCRGERERGRGGEQGGA